MENMDATPRSTDEALLHIAFNRHGGDADYIRTRMDERTACDEPQEPPFLPGGIERKNNGSNGKAYNDFRKATKDFYIL